jgi:Mlc titration factor MtfA (ptsG expression regulator)
MIIGKLFGGAKNWLGGAARRACLPDELWRETVDGLPFLAGLAAEELARLKDLAERFLAEKEFTAAGGLDLTDAMCASIAVQGCLPILNLGLGCYRGWVGIVVYPDEFVIPRSVEDEFGVIHEYDDIASGEAWEGGPLLVSWRDARMAGEGYNVVIHEFAHKLDMMNGEADGIPPLPAGISRQEWEETLLAAFGDFCQRVDEAEAHGEMPAIDPYASENPGEFFAVASEIFFEIPEALDGEYPALYGLFSRFYRQDPLVRKSSGAPRA